MNCCNLCGDNKNKIVINAIKDHIDDLDSLLDYIKTTDILKDKDIKETLNKNIIILIDKIDEINLFISS